MRSRAWLLCIPLLVLFVPFAHADDKPASVADTDYGELHPFGIRGLERPFGRYEKERRPLLTAIDRGLDWLVARQEDDGSFRPDLRGGGGNRAFTTGVTALCALALLGRGYDGTGDGSRDVALRRALEYLVKNQNKEGCFGRVEMGHYVYNHAFAAYALVEAFGVTGDPRWREHAQRGLDFIALMRNPYFGWRYGIKPGDNDTSVATCCMLALLAARRVNQTAKAVGLPAPFVTDESAEDGLQAWLRKVTDPDDGRVGYFLRGEAGAGYEGSPTKTSGDHVEPNTAGALWWWIEVSRLGLLDLKWRGIPPTKASGYSRDLLKRSLPTWAEGEVDLYYWFFASMAFHALGKKDGEVWSGALQKALLAGQSGNGSWDPIGVWCNHGGRLYSTAMALLALETPGRLSGPRAAWEVLNEALRVKSMAPALRARVFAYLGRRKIKNARSTLLKGVKHEAPPVRAGALDGLRYLGDEHRSVLKAVSAAFADQEALVRVAAVRAANALAPEDPTLRALIEKAAEDTDATVREAAAVALGGAGAETESGRQALEKALAAEEPRARLAAAKALRDSGYPAANLVPVLVAVLASKDPALERDALAELDVIGIGAAEAATALDSYLASPTPWVRYHAASALWKIRKQPLPTAKALAGILSEQDEKLAARVVALILETGAVEVVPVQRLGPLLRCEDDDLRRFAIARLDGLGQKDATAIYELALLRYTTYDEDEAKAAAAALAKMGISEAHALTAAAAGLRNHSTVGRASWALQKAGAAAVPVLLDQMEAAKGAHLLAVLDVLREVGPKTAEARTRLQALLKTTKDAAARQRIVWVLEAVDEQSGGSVAGLVKVLEEEEDPEVLRQTIWALHRQIGKAEGVIEALCAALGRFTNPKLQGEVISALQGSVATSKEAQEAVIGAAVAPSAGVRYAALHSLSRIEPKTWRLFDVFGGAIGDPVEKVRHFASTEIAGGWGVAEHTLPLLLIALESDDWFVRRHAGEMFQTGGKQNVTLLRAEWKKGQRLIGVSRAMGWTGKPALASFKYWVNSRKKPERIAATYGLGIMGQDLRIWDATELIFKRLRIEKDPEVKQALRDALQSDMSR